MRAAEVRKVLQDYFIEPARRAGHKTITIVAREVARLMVDLGYLEARSRFPLICEVLLSQKTERELNVRRVGVDGTCPSTTCTVTYEILGAPVEEGEKAEVKEKPLVPERRESFEERARRKMAEYFNVDVFPFPYRAEGWPKAFDIVSRDLQVVGDVKAYTMVRGVSIPPAKFSTIAEHVWFLEKIAAQKKFLVFGKDRRVPEEWLKRYGYLVRDVEFYFLDEQGNLEKLWPR